MSHRYTTIVALAAALALPAGSALAQTYISPGSLPAAAATRGVSAAPADAEIALPQLSVQADPVTTGSIHGRHPVRTHAR